MITPRHVVRGAPVPPARRERGQATVEFALVLPFLMLFMLAFVQVGIVARDYVLVVHAARAAVREASVDAPSSRVHGAATHVLKGASVTVGPRGAVGDPITATVRYTARTNLPIVGALFPDLTLSATAVMRIEH
ncbi:MAG: TadE-like protein [Actinomycetia bacterium]|nr:TadE-like protein [Actinomycetes bacterium]